MAAFTRGVCFGLRRYASLMCRRVAKFPAVTRKSRMCVTAAIGGLCAVPFIQEQEALSHEALVRRASSLVTDSTNTLLSQTTLALVDSFTQYVKAVQTLESLHRHYVSSASRLTPAEEDAVWQVIVRQRKKISELREDCERFESSWVMAVNLSELAAEAAYSAGADQACVMARNSLQVSQAHVEQSRQLSLQAENSLKESNAEDSQRAAAMTTEEEEEIPEAYLRED